MAIGNLKNRKPYNWCVTIKKEGYDIGNFKRIFDKNKDLIRYLGFGEEIGKNTEYEHYQIYIQLYSTTRLRGLKKILECNSAHCENQRGTNPEARDYCMKEGKFHEFGKFCEGQGSRTDIIEILEEIDEGLEDLDIYRPDGVYVPTRVSNYMRYGNFFQKHRERVEKRNNMKMREVAVNVIYGDAATGKTQGILTKEGIENCYILNDPRGDNKCWNGYAGERVLVLDDFYSWLPFSEMLRIMDNKPMRVRQLGGYRMAQWTKVYITSNESPKQWYSGVRLEDVGDKARAFDSRIKKCLKVTRGNTGALVCKWKTLCKFKRNSYKEYLDVGKYFGGHFNKEI